MTPSDPPPASTDATPSDPTPPGAPETPPTSKLLGRLVVIGFGLLLLFYIVPIFLKR